MDDRLDNLITEAAPPVPHTAGRAVLLGQIIAETQLAAAAGRLRTGRRRCLIASTILVAIGAGVGVVEVSQLFLPAVNR